VRRGNGRRVTDELRKRMIKLRRQGLTYKQIGQKVGYSEWTVAVNIKK
jgi:DNA-binding CsgD family transcriptional regulator